MHTVHHSLFIVLLIVFQGKSQTSSETEASIDDAITEESTRSEPPTEAEVITTTLESLLEETNDEMTSIDTITVDGLTNVEPSTGTQPITTTAKTLLEETNDETTFPQDISESTSDASPTITINLPTLAFDSTTRVPETASAAPTTPKLCKENEVYSCLPWCPRTCNNLLSKIICRPVPSHIKLCRRGCTCKAGYLLEKTIGRCVEECPTKQAL